MKKACKRVSVLVLTFIVFTMSTVTALADGIEGDEDFTPYLALGADLKDSEKETVMKLLGLEEADLADYDVIEVTNADEHKYLGDYVSKDIIGTRALSSVLIVKQEKGNGIGVDTHNITYCTSGMYCNALITAGIEDAEVTVAGPFDITGTAALVGAMKAYSVMTGEDVTEESMDAATNELVVTGDVAENTGDTKKTEELIALVKQKVFEENLATKEDIREAIEEASKSLELKLSDADIEKIVDLMDKISGLDLNIESIKNQAKELYDKLADLDIDTDGLADKIGGFFSSIFTAIVDFFKGLF